MAGMARGQEVGVPNKPNRYTQINEDIFFQHYREGYRLVAADELSPEELQAYRLRSL